MDKKNITITCKLKDPKGFFIKNNATETLTIIINDGMAIFYFSNFKSTANFANFEIQANIKYNKPKNTRLDLRRKKAYTLYPNKTKEEIKDIILNQLKQLGINLKNLKEK
jgi:hypothetical protein